ncbi:MAG: TatD family hydrolase [Candidatus Omnitrophota bacterium]|nr:TatD family hydrolase [Candidatus Omnitrophota bacterium]
MLIDTHCHLDFKDFKDDRDAVLKRSIDSGVGVIINVGSSMEGTARSIELAAENDFIYAAAGIHPHEADKARETDMKLFAEFLDKPKVVAVGEIGLDYYRNISSKENQKKLFEELLQKAKEKTLPLIIHNRESHQDMLDILSNVIGSHVFGVMHCFSGDEMFLKKCLDRGFFISFTCNITYKNAGKLREIAKLVPMDRLLIETDAPFLAPQDFRGKRNEPAYVKYAAEEIAKIKGISFEEVSNITTLNAKKLFRL